MFSAYTIYTIQACYESDKAVCGAVTTVSDSMTTTGA